MMKLAFACALLSSISYADDIYLNAGFVIRNVRVIDTTDDQITIERNDQKIKVPLDGVLRIEVREFVPNQISVYELFSRDLYERHQKFLREKEALVNQHKEVQDAIRIDSMRKREEHLDDVYSWRKSMYLAGGWGVPQGFRFELGYNIDVNLGIGLVFGTGDAWSGHSTLGILASVRLPKQSSTIVPYVLVSVGGTTDIFGNNDNYTLVDLGAIVPIKPWLQLRPEIGCDFTSKYISGGFSFFEGSQAEVKEERTRFGAHLGIEIDLRQVF